ncbi:hypothetical protein [Zunongwangia sp.]|uniref:hypothetical protein n=1 Tax=Zunongwangia sp. TaxID=1965325 RepID=UPI003AA94D39
MGNKEKKLDEFTKKIFKESNLEIPSFDFTDKVMANLPEFTMAKATRVNTSESKIKYEPLISKKGWAMIAAFVATLLSSPYFYSGGESSDLVVDKWIKMKSIFNLSIEMPNIGVLNADVLAISAALFTVYFLLEIFLLNNWMNKKSLV